MKKEALRVFSVKAILSNLILILLFPVNSKSSL